MVLLALPRACLLKTHLFMKDVFVYVDLHGFRLQRSPIHQTQHQMRHCRSLQQNQKHTFFHLASKTLRLAPASVSHSRVLRGNQCHRQDLHNSGCSTETRETSQENSSACILGKACMCRPAPGRCWSRGRVEISALS